MLRIYSIEQATHTKETTLAIISEGELATTPNTTALLEVFEEGYLIKVSGRNILELEITYSDFHQLLNQYRERLLENAENLIRLLHIHSQQERYLYFEKLYPNLRGRIPQYILASYLNISYSQLSRIRSSLSKSTKKKNS
ncbi:MAG: hypothetical protein QM669_07225 [Siphonobacter sp.]